jgi:hypothetical protein
MEEQEVHCGCTVTDGNTTSTAYIPVTTRFKSGDCIQVERYYYWEQEPLFINQYSVMDTNSKMPPTTPTAKQDFVEYRGWMEHEHGMLCRALQTILEDAFHPMRKKPWSPADSETYHRIDKQPATLTLKELQQLILSNVSKDYARPKTEKYSFNKFAYHETFLMEFGTWNADALCNASLL